MATITTNKTKQVVMRNRIDVDGVPCKFQEYTINSDDPAKFNKSEWEADEAAKQLYKENRVAIRTAEAEFEDEVFALSEAMEAEKRRS
ncbi:MULTISPECIES: hypothetical protein [Erysipelotrichaceae]|uniref:hypothetical protein n=1 Tax=Erysipelotrichaceae TaxID=128827 RepID=UPI000E477732|nr:hypothetical protein [Absiella sp. AM27-20]RHU03341.1 hypothetical protein DW716_16085 [Absiella sp. AM27-20]